MGNVPDNIGTIARQAPGIIILQIGSNDLGKTKKKKLQIAEDILQLASDMKKLTGTILVIVCQSKRKCITNAPKTNSFV